MTGIDYMAQFIGSPYIFGGNTPQGWDCSGMVCELLRFWGVMGDVDKSAQMIYDSFSQHRDFVLPGPNARFPALVFYGRDTEHISHVAFKFNDTQVLEAAGGDRNTTSRHAAEDDRAFTRVRPLSYRRDIVATLVYIGEEE